jgi:hypothetical protein
MRCTELTLMPVALAIAAAVQCVVSPGGSAPVKATTRSITAWPSGGIADKRLLPAFLIEILPIYRLIPEVGEQPLLVRRALETTFLPASTGPQGRVRLRCGQTSAASQLRPERYVSKVASQPTSSSRG